MGHVTVEDSAGCIDREALEAEETPVLGELLLATFEIRGSLTGAGSDLEDPHFALDIAIGCARDSVWCRKNFEPGPDGLIHLPSARVTLAECASVHSLVLTRTKTTLGPLLVAWPPPSERPPSTAVALAFSGGPGPIAPRVSLGVARAPPPQGRIAPVFGVRATVGAPVRIEGELVGCSADTPACHPVYAVGSAALQGLAAVRSEALGPLQIEGGALIGPMALWGVGYPEDKLALATLLTLELGLGLSLGTSTLVTLGVGYEPIRLVVEPGADRLPQIRGSGGLTIVWSPSRGNPPPSSRG